MVKKNKKEEEEVQEDQEESEKKEEEEVQEDQEESEKKEELKVQLVTTEQMMLLKFEELNTGLSVLNQKLDKIISLAKEEEKEE